MIEKGKNGVSNPKNDLLKKMTPPNFFEQHFFSSNLINTMIEKPENGVSHPKNDLLKKNYPPKNYFEQYFFSSN